MPPPFNDDLAVPEEHEAVEFMLAGRDGVEEIEDSLGSDTRRFRGCAWQLSLAVFAGFDVRPAERDDPEENEKDSGSHGDGSHQARDY
jgi:hypothetical protein